MRFAFSDEQLALRSAVHDLLAKECPASEVRMAWANSTGRTGRAWRALAEMGVLGVVAPETAGGFGGDEVDLVGVLAETGRVYVGTGSAPLELLSVHPAGKKAMPAADWWRGAGVERMTAR